MHRECAHITVKARKHQRGKDIMSDDIVKSSLEAYLERAIASEEGRLLALSYAFEDLQTLSMVIDPDVREQLSQLGKNANKLTQLIEDVLKYTEGDD